MNDFKLIGIVNYPKSWLLIFKDKSNIDKWDYFKVRQKMDVKYDISAQQAKRDFNFRS